jgi:two-component system response regulator NreC
MIQTSPEARTSTAGGAAGKLSGSGFSASDKTGKAAYTKPAANMELTRVLVADDHETIRNGLRFIVGNLEGFEICGEASDGREAVDFAISLQPDIVVLDMGMPGLNGLDAARQIKKHCPKTEILAFTGIEEEKLIHQMFEAGARGYLLKTDTRDTIQAALKALAQHKSYFTTRIGEVLFARFLHGKDNVAQSEEEPGRLTPREREIVQLLAEGKSNKEVSAMLGISMKTAETHRAAIMKKLNLDSLAALVRYAIRNNIVAA